MNPSFPHLDRLLTLCFFYPLIRIRRQARERRIPILMYHSISDGPESGHPYFWINTSPERFREHMQFLHDNNYKVISLSEAVRLISEINQADQLNKHSKLYKLNGPSKFNELNTVVLTFDDGFRDFFTEAFPILKKYGFPATVFLPTAYIHTRRKMFNGRECLNWQDVTQLHKYGVRFGSHTVNHMKLSSLTIKEIEYEIQHSKKVIENNIAFPVESFSYPFAFPQDNKEFINLLKNLLSKNGYNSGVTTIIGTNSKNDDKFFLKRIPVNSYDDISFFSSKLKSGYDWVKIFQYYYKYFKNSLRN